MRAVLAAEDATFFEHRGISLSACCARCWVNLSSGEVQQGGSTLTQQLVKNLYLTPERTLVRKVARGGALAAGRAALRQGGDPRGLPQRDLLGPRRRRQPDGPRRRRARLVRLRRARARRGRGRAPRRHAALARRPRSGASSRGEPRAPRRGAGADARAGLARPRRDGGGRRASRRSLCSPAFAPRRRAYFLDAAGARGAPALRARGAALARLRAAHDARPRRPGRRRGGAGRGLARTARRRGAPRAGLQGALLSLDPAAAPSCAWVGGRSYQDSQFDRVELARRQPGSAFKPVVFAAAFAHGVADPVDPARGRAAGARGRRQGRGSRRTSTTSSAAG